ncbi:hypothetical protein QQ056_17095 [Oscillatoria laete-virens NRMC-F 0139]|nr:hypothetical protein [Oscillatoria laete-virens]MDL5055250.1 hypothetical protein [Oscillatoria laete-virens NRMC-F 0139]
MTNKIFEIRKRIAFEAMSEKEQVEALTKEMEDLRKSSSLEDQARAAELELELQRRGSSPAAMVSAPRLDSLAQLGGGIAGVNYDAILNTAKPVEEKQLATQERIAESSDQIARTVSRFGIAEI